MSTSEAFYRNAIDLNRYSNSVSKKIIKSYNDVVLEAAARLATVDELNAPQTAVRLRTLLSELQLNLGSWSIDSSKVTALELQGLAQLQSDFISNELKKVFPKDFRKNIKTVYVSPDFAESVVKTDPTKLNVFALPGEFERSIKEGMPQPVFRLTAGDGAVITLPNGQTVEKAFRGLASSQSDLFRKTVRNGLLSGDSTQQIVRNLIGRLHFGQAGSVRQIAQAGGSATKMANQQIMTIVRTSINQVSNSASQKVYEANQDVTDKYEYVATLDSKTSAVCARLDGQTFIYGNGPTPPQHFNCRSTTVPIVNWNSLEKKYPTLKRPKETNLITRPSESGRVPQGMTYADWLLKQPRSVQAEVFGKWKSQYFVKLSKKEGAQSALRKIVRKDGSELTLKQLESRYPFLSDA